MFPNSGSRWSWWLDGVAVFALVAILVLPLFRIEYLNAWPSIEGSFIADGRALLENWPHHQWQPLWYCGNRADYVYPPGVRYGIAITSALLHVSPARGYHVFIGLFYAAGFVILYLWARSATGSRRTAWIAAVSIALISPSLALLPEFRKDSIYRVCWRLHVMIMYGEGPHISSLAVLPVAWWGAWRRFHGGSARWLCLSAIGVALTVTLNFYGMTAIAITMPLLVLACFLERADWRMVRDGAWIAILAWALTAWWLTPSYVQLTARNLYLFQSPGNQWSKPVLIALIAAYLIFSFVLRRMVRIPAYPFFIWSAAAWLAIYILGFRWFGFQIAGQSHRLIPELDLFVTLCGIQLAGIVWKWRPQGWVVLVPRVALVVALFFVYRPAWRYLKHPYDEFPVDRHWAQRVEYKTETWLYEHFPDQRAFVTGTIRFWFDAWHDVQDADGAQQQGMENPLLPGAQWLIMHATEPGVAKAWLQATGVDILVVPGKDSQEPYKDIDHPAKYDADLILLRDDGEGNRYYRVPRGAAGIVRIVDRARLEAVPPIQIAGPANQVRAYADAVESGPPGDGARGRWSGSDVLNVNADIGPGQALLVQETYDPGWHAYEDGRAVPIRADAVGHMLIALTPGSHSIKMVFQAPAEVVIGRIAGVLCLLSIALLAFRRQA